MAAALAGGAQSHAVSGCAGDMACHLIQVLCFSGSSMRAYRLTQRLYRSGDQSNGNTLWLGASGCHCCDPTSLLHYVQAVIIGTSVCKHVDADYIHEMVV